MVDLVTPLLQANNCNLEEAEKTLLRHGKHNELVLLYQMKEQHVKALELLREQSKRESATDGGRKTSCAGHRPFPRLSTATGPVLPSSSGSHQRMITYLQQLGWY